MVKKDQKWEWTERQEKVFGELKKKFTKKLVLAACQAWFTPGWKSTGWTQR